MNRCYLPIHVTTIKRAVSLLFLEIAKGVDHEYQTYSWEDLSELADLDDEENYSFHEMLTVKGPIRIPKVIALVDYDQVPHKMVKFSRSHIFIRDGHTCQYCGEPHSKQKLNLDHVIPRAQGGRTTWENIVASCHTCNRKKGGRTPDQAGMPLLTKPKKPVMHPLFSFSHSRMLRAWTPFLVKN